METSQKVVVTGGAGFIGSHLVKTLFEKGFEVHSIDNYSGGRFPARVVEGVIYHEGDVRDEKLLNALFANAKFVFHTAALPRVQYSIEQPVETNDVNISGTVAVLAAAVRANVLRVVYSASSSAYGDQEKMPLTEDMEAHPKSPYALQKYTGELYCRLFSESYNLETVSLRYFNVYGKNADPHGPYALVVAKFILQRLNKEPMTIVGTGENTRDYTHVEDIVAANLLAAVSPNVGAGEVINIGGGRNLSVLEVAAMVGGDWMFVESRIEPKNTLADTSRAKELLGWSPNVTFEKGLRELKDEAGLI